LKDGCPSYKTRAPGLEDRAARSERLWQERGASDDRGPRAARSGKILIEDEDEDEDATWQTVETRGVVFAFQYQTVFRHMTVEQNVAFRPSIRKVPPAESRERVKELLALVQLDG